MKSLPRRRAAILSVAVLVAASVSLVGCASTDPATVVNAAATGAREASASELTMRIAVGSEVVEFTGTFSGDGRYGRMDVSAVDPSMSEALMIDGKYFYRMDGLPQGKRWLVMTQEEVSPGVDPAAAVADPADALALLEATAEGVEELGEKDLRGDTVKGYRVTVDRDAALAARVADGTFTDAAAEEQRSTLPEEFPVDVWIDPDGLPAEMAFSLQVDSPGDGPVEVTLTMSFLSWDAELDLSEPPASEVITLAELTGADRS